MFGMGKKAGAKPAKAPAAAKARPRLVTMEVRVTAAQQKKFKALGGDAWLRERIDAADSPAAPVNPFDLDA